MSELPREARELLELARDAHEPPDAGARDRVRRGVATAVAVGAGVALSGKAIAAGGKAGLFASTGAKLATLGSAIVLAGAVAVGAPLVANELRAPRPKVVQKAPRPPAAATEVAPPVVEAEPPSQAPVLEPPRAEPPGPRHVPRRVRAHGPEVVPQEPAPDALRAEMLLLRAASDALTAGQVGVAVAKLDEHAQRFAHGQLGEEREGLRVIARCMRDERGARVVAQRYLRRHPQSVLAVRAKSACKLDGAP
jgi:hypothetical protein